MVDPLKFNWNKLKSEYGFSFNPEVGPNYLKEKIRKMEDDGQKKDLKRKLHSLIDNSEEGSYQLASRNKEFQINHRTHNNFTSRSNERRSSRSKSRSISRDRKRSRSNREKESYNSRGRSRSRERETYNFKERSRNKELYNFRDRSRSRSRGRRRSRSRSRSRDRKARNVSYKSRSRSRGRRRSRSRSRSRDRKARNISYKIRSRSRERKKDISPKTNRTNRNDHQKENTSSDPTILQTGLNRAIFDKIFAGEISITGKTCQSKDSKLWCYRIQFSPPLLFLSQFPTIIGDLGREFTFDGFNIISHFQINSPPVVFDKGGVEYYGTFIEEELPQSFDREPLDWIHDYLFDSILGISNWLPRTQEFDGCRYFHIYPRFFNSQYGLLSCHKVKEFLQAPKPTILQVLDQFKRNASSVLELKDQIIMTEYPGPVLRLDGISYNDTPNLTINVLNQGFMSLIKYVKTFGFSVKDENQPLAYYFDTQASKRTLFIPELTKLIGVRCDVTQMAILLPRICYHIRLYSSLSILEEKLGIIFNEKALLRKALTHSSYVEGYNKSLKELQEINKKVGFSHNIPFFQKTQSKGFSSIIEQLEKEKNNHSAESMGELFSHITHNERLEFLGDAILEYISSSHLFFQFPHLKEGELSDLRSGIVTNKMLAHLIENCDIHNFILCSTKKEYLEDGFQHSHMQADCFEALLGAIYLDQGLNKCRQFLASCLFKNDPLGEKRWLQAKIHPLQVEETDRHLIETTPVLMKFTQLEEITGHTFRHIKLLVQAFTHPSLTRFDTTGIGVNQRLEFLGDAVLQFLSTRYLFTFFPTHQEGQLTLLRGGLLNNKRMAEIAFSLGFSSFLRYLPSESLLQEGKLHPSIMADTFEAFLGALYCDAGLEKVDEFLKKVLYSSINEVIEERSWLDPKTRLYHSLQAIEKNLNYFFKVLSETGPPHLKIFTVGLFIQDKLISKGQGYSRISAEQNAAIQALENNKFLNIL